jgi:CheY-like chemotaxis protein
VFSKILLAGRTAVATEDVLIIDDNSGMRHVLTVLLEDEGFSAASCPDGAAALDLAKKQHFKIYIIDYRLPEMMGDAIAAELRKMHPDSFIIGYSIENKEEPFLKAGVDKFIVKDDLINQLIPSIKDTAR